VYLSFKVVVAEVSRRKEVIVHGNGSFRYADRTNVTTNKKTSGNVHKITVVIISAYIPKYSGHLKWAIFLLESLHWPLVLLLLLKVYL